MPTTAPAAIVGSTPAAAPALLTLALALAALADAAADALPDAFVAEADAEPALPVAAVLRALAALLSAVPPPPIAPTKLVPTPSVIAKLSMTEKTLAATTRRSVGSAAAACDAAAISWLSSTCGFSVWPAATAACTLLARACSGAAVRTPLTAACTAVLPLTPLMYEETSAGRFRPARGLEQRAVSEMNEGGSGARGGW